MSGRQKPSRLFQGLLAIFFVHFWAFTGLAAMLPPGQVGNLLEVTNGNVRLEYNLTTGRANFYWQNSLKIYNFYAGVQLQTYITGTVYTSHAWTVTNNQVTVTSTSSALPTMSQVFIFDQNDSFLTRVSMVGANLSATWMGPVVVDSSSWASIGITNDNRALFVPFDNDHFVCYNSEPMNGSDVGNEVAAFYDNVSRNGLVVGSVTHDTWKTGIYWSGANNQLKLLNVYGGVTNYWTWDVMPHGPVVGNVVSSPLMFVGFGNDWRTTMENFANENALYAPMLPWTNGVPFGWNSWGVTNYQSDISYSAAIAVSDSIHTNLQPHGFTNGGTVYVNLDSYWDNLSDSQLVDFVDHCHANGQRAGVYWGPFVYWGTLAQSSNQIVPGTSDAYTYSDILLRTTNGSAISNDGAYAIDPTHPGTQELIQYQINFFNDDFFDYIKLDFLSHGSLEGVHYNTNITTGMEAYNQGMQYLLSQIGGRMFISESIAPIFPYQYGNSRRIACDAEQSEIGNTAYTMNGVTSGWWISGRLYQFNDPDILVFDNGPTTNEAQSRLINGAITGLFLNGSILTNAVSISMAQMCLTNSAINNVARVGRTFRPVDGGTGTNAGHIFVRQDGETWCIAVFNYFESATTNETVNFNSAGLPAGTFVATNLWDGTTVTASNSMNVSLNAAQAKLFQLALVSPPPQPVISAAAVTNNAFICNGSNGIAGWNYSVVASTNLAVPVAQWQVISSNQFDACGNFSFTNSLGPAEQFYLIKVQ